MRSSNRFCLYLALMAIAFLASASQSTAQVPAYDLLLKGGHVIDPANNVDAVLDVAIPAEKSLWSAKTFPPPRRKK